MKTNIYRPDAKLYKLIVCIIIWSLQTFVFAYQWINYYSFTVVIQGLGTKFYFKGHVLFITIYFVLLFFFQKTYGSDDIVHLKGMEGMVSQLVPICIVNIFGYFMISLLRNWTVRISPILLVTILQLVISETGIIVGRSINQKCYCPVSALFLYRSEKDKNILEKIDSLNDVKIIDSLCISEGLDRLKMVIEKGYQAVVLQKPEGESLEDILKYCYACGLHIYIIPSIADVLIKGSVQLHFSDVPVLYVNNRAITVGQELIKRMLDILLSLILLLPASIIILIFTVLIKFEDRGPVFYRQKRCTKDNKVFYIIKLRSMKIDAESNGIAKLAEKDDIRITSVGKIIRKFRFDELPQLWNILKGEMSFVGPRPERPEIIQEYLKERPEFVFRTKVKAGLTGFAQVYGKYNTSYQDKLKLDLFYIENYSIWLDLKLCMVTLKTIFKSESAEGIKKD